MISCLECLIIQKKKRITKAYNKKFKSKTFAFDDFSRKVILSMDQKDNTLGKWPPNWEVPFRISHVFSNKAYEIEELTPEGRIIRINDKYLKQYMHML